MNIQPIKTPAKIIANQASDFFGTFTWGPLEPGFGATLGNSLRRVLFASAEGHAITHIKLPPGILHEFDTKEGVVEDFIDIQLNLKKVRLKKINEQKENKVRVSLKGATVFKAGDIAKSSASFEVLNPDLVICNMSKKMNLEFEFTIGKGRGYAPAEEHKKEEQTIGEVTIDARYTPIKNVSIQVDNVLVGQKTDFEKLIVNISTDGSIKPGEALKNAAEVLMNHFMILVNEEIKPLAKEDKEDQKIQGEALRISKLLMTPLEELDLPPRAKNSLKAHHVNCLGDIVGVCMPDLMKFRNFGRQSVRALQRMLRQKGLSLGMDVSDYKAPKDTK